MAKLKYPDTLRIAALLAEAKGDGDWRLLHDGSHGVAVNPGIKVRDQHATATISDKQTCLAIIRKNGCPRIGLKGDVREAHRTFLIAEFDRVSQACELGGTVILNNVGAQGIASSAYWCNRLFGVVVRVVYRIL